MATSHDFSIFFFCLPLTHTRPPGARVSRVPLTSLELRSGSSRQAGGASGPPPLQVTSKPSSQILASFTSPGLWRPSGEKAILSKYRSPDVAHREGGRSEGGRRMDIYGVMWVVTEALESQELRLSDRTMNILCSFICLINIYIYIYHTPGVN